MRSVSLVRLTASSCLWAALALLLSVSPLDARDFTVVTYNVENLFDADQVAMFDDYADNGQPASYTPQKLLTKLQTIGKVLSTFNHGAGPEVICFNEFEIDFTPDSKVTDYAAFLQRYRRTTVAEMLTTGLNNEIRGLPVEALLLKHLTDIGLTGYHVAAGTDEPDFAAMASTDRRVHKKAHKNVIFSKFPIIRRASHATPDARDILEAQIDVDGHRFIIFVNHWKSGAGDFSAEQTRRFNAKNLRDRVDQILAEDPAADILLAGDFNSQYNQTQAYPFMGKTGLNDVLGSQGDEAKTAAGGGFSLYNLWYELPPSQRRSDFYNNKWGTLMQKIISPGLYDFHGVQYVDGSFSIAIIDGLNAITPFQLPKRWSNAGNGSGASDHFPIHARFRTVPQNDKSKRVVPPNPGREDGGGMNAIDFGSLDPAKTPVFTESVAAEIGQHMGEIFRIRGTISLLKPLTLTAHGSNYLLHSPKVSLRKRMQQYPKDSEVELLAQLGMHRGRLQFRVLDEKWILREPEKN